MGKTRLSPLKAITIPRLELTAAVLMVQLSQGIQAELPLDFTKIVYWTDSVPVLQYITNERNRFHTFVANRVAKIRDATLPSQWRHVGSEENPTDEGYRGLSGEQIQCCQWLSGPIFLWKRDEFWPNPPLVLVESGVFNAMDSLKADPEVKVIVGVCQVATTGNEENF